MAVAEEGEGGPVGGTGASYASNSPSKFSDGKVILTIQALRAALLINYMCSF